ncbi:hypothetical protein L6232_27345, partial [Shewanella sp. C31]|nr:hypothetical protein [Shewanella electrica]
GKGAPGSPRPPSRAGWGPPPGAPPRGGGPGCVGCGWARSGRTRGRGWGGPPGPPPWPGPGAGPPGRRPRPGRSPTAG